MLARSRAILDADAEYQELRTAYTEAKKSCDKLFSIANHYRFTVGVSNSIFFHIKARGDSWEEVIAKLTEKQPAWHKKTGPPARVTQVKGGNAQGGQRHGSAAVLLLAAMDGETK